jgi:hypothetical protein
LSPGARQLRALDEERRVLEDGVLTAVVEMKVAVDDDLHVGWAQVVLGKRVSGVPVHHLPLLDELSRPSNPSVDQDRANPRMFDHKPVHRYVIQPINACQVEADDLHLLDER